MSSEPLAPLDLAFWSLESDAHPLHLGALGVFTADSPAAARRAAGLLTERAAGVPGLRMRIRDVRLPVGAAVREPDAGFEPAAHVRLTAATGDFVAAAGELMAGPLDRQRPPWEAYVLPGADATAFAVLFKFHHALADGLRALTLAAGVMDPSPGADRRTGPEREPHGEERAPGVLGLLPGTLRRVADPRALIAAPRALAGAVRHHVEDTARAVDIGASVVRAAWGVRSTPALTAAASGTRRTAGAVLDLDDVHRVRKQTGGTVNDVLIAVVAGALRRWLDERGPGGEGLAPRALIPVSRRRPRGDQPSGNRLSGYLLRLPVGEPDPLARVRAVRAAMDRNKHAGPDRGAGAVALLAERVPPLGHRLGGPVVAQAARLLFDLLVTSVPLPSLGLRLGGCELAAVYPFAPLAQGQSLAVAVSTYRGRVHYGLLADAAAVPDLERLAAALHTELTGLTGLAEACGER